jgi:hypothetical protein
VFGVGCGVGCGAVYRVDCEAHLCGRVLALHGFDFDRRLRDAAIAAAQPVEQSMRSAAAHEMQHTRAVQQQEEQYMR